MKSTRNTVQKQIIYSVACSLFHPTADEVYNCVLLKRPHISRATVFRVLNGLTECGKLKRVSVYGGADRFDTTLTEHNHIRCVKCHRVDDVEATMETVGSFAGYGDVKCNALFEGICPECAKK